jgi:hypothetical protein
MKLFNLNITILEEQSGVEEINTYTVEDCQINPIKGKIVGFQFFVEIEGKIFFLTQTDEQDIIEYIPPDAASPDDWVVCLDNNNYDGCWNELNKYLSPPSIHILSNLTLFKFINNPLFSSPFRPSPFS